MSFHRLLVTHLLSIFITVAGAAFAHSSQPTQVTQVTQEPQPPSKSSLKNNQGYYVGECKKFVTQKLYEAALFSCYNAYQLGSTDMGAVLYHLGKNHFFDEVTSNNLMQEYNVYKGSPEIQRLLMNIKFTSQSDEVVQGSIYGSWCFDKDLNHEAESSDYEGYARLVINPTGQYIQASAKIQSGSFTYSKNTLNLGYPSFSEFQVEIVDQNQLILKAKPLKTNAMKKAQVYSRKSCSKRGMQRFIQALVNNKSTTNCDDISNYLGRQLIPVQYLPTAILNKLKQDPKRYQCQQLIQKISGA
jgi:hypothetical protein